MNLVEISTSIFLVCSFLVLIPVALVGWDMYWAVKADGADIYAQVLAYNIFLITVVVLIFHIAQFASVSLGALGYSMQTRVPIIFLIDGSLILLMAVYFYVYFRIRTIRNRIERNL